MTYSLGRSTPTNRATLGGGCPVPCCRMAWVPGVGTDWPPERGAQSSRGAAAVWTGAVRVRHRGLRPASVVRYQARRFRCRFVPAGLALRRHGRVKIEERRNPPRTLPARFGSLALGLAVGPVARSAGTMAKSSALGLTSVAARRRVSARASPPLLRSARDQTSGTTTVAAHEQPPGLLTTHEASRVRRIGTCRSEGFQNASIRHPPRGLARCPLYRIPLACRDSASGASRNRTGDLLLAKQALSQLSYGPWSPQYTRCRADSQSLMPAGVVPSEMLEPLLLSIRCLFRSTWTATSYGLAGLLSTRQKPL